MPWRGGTRAQPPCDGIGIVPTPLADRLFVGRSIELAHLEACLDAAMAGRGQLALIAGEPGIGKTRLAGELAQRAADRGMDVAWGRCSEDAGAPALWPWIQVLRTCGAASDDGSATTLIHELTPELDGLLPELGGAARTQASLLPSPLESERSRFLLFDSIGRFLHRMASRRPLLLVFDDIHAADIPSLLLLQFLTRSFDTSPVMVVGTHREAEVRRDPRLAEIFALLERRAERVALRGWQTGEVGSFLEKVLGMRPHDSVVAKIAEITAGNPLFVDGFAHQMRGRTDSGIAGVPAAVPDSIRATIHQRLKPLPTVVRELLDTAAVIGQRFDPRLLAKLTDQPLADVLDRLVAAGRTDLVTLPDTVAGSYAFAHPLVRQTLYTDLAPTTRMSLHHRCAVALEGLYAEHLDEHAHAIAHHYLESARAEDVPHAVDYAVRAAGRSLVLCAYEEAALLYERALAALEAAGGSLRRRCEVLVALGEAHLRAGSTLRAREVCASAARIAQELGAGSLHARAALFFGGIVIGVGIPDPELLRLLETSLELLDDHESELRAIVSARLAVRLPRASDQPRRIALTRDALEQARRSGSHQALAYALDAQHMALWESASIPSQLAVAGELIGAAEACGNRELILHGVHLRISDYLEAGDIDAADREIAEYETLADGLRQAHYTFRARSLRAMRAMMNGEFDRSERLAAEAVEIGEQVQTPLVIAFRAAFALAFDRVRGRHETAEAIARPLVEAFPTIAGIRLGLAALYADFGRTAEAATLFASSVAADLGDIPRDNNWLLSMSLAAELCVRLHEGPLATRLFRRLEPFVDRQAVGASGWTSLGSMARPLGLLAAALGRQDEAIALLERALEAHRRMRAHAFIVHTQLDLAEILARDPRAGAVSDRVVQLAEDALAQARVMGMDRHQQRAESLLATPVASPRAVALEASWRREGDYWTITFGAQTCRLKDVRGLHYLARLLATPGEEHHCLELMGVPATAWVAAGDAVPALDARAKTAYRERLRELRAEIDDAEQCRDHGRTERARGELEILEQELRRALGLGGRDRNAGTATERSRVTVAKSLRLALTRIAAHHPDLAAHLRATLRTGTHCVYAPDPQSGLRWRVVG